MNAMINIFKAILLTLLVSALYAQEKNVAKKDSAGVKEVSINLPTMKCNQCKKTIQGALTKVEGVTEVNIDLNKKAAIVKYAEAKVNLSDLRLAVTKAGYDADELKRDSTAYQKLDSCCK